MAKKKSQRLTPVESLKHRDSRKNIPTEELRDFYHEEAPQTQLYPRDPSLDPQLVWKGKDEQDARPLEVPVVPIYIQEKIHPQAIVEDLRARYGKQHERQLDLFADFNGIDTFEKKVSFYQYDAHWSNRMILGDSLTVMTSLAEKEGLKGQVQMIYIDPPYGIRFGSNWQVSTRKRDVKDGKVEDATRQPEQVKAFRDTWELGIHSYLTYLRDRLTVARELLTESGSIFVQIGDENVHLVRSVLDEVFGPDAFISEITFQKTTTASSDLLGGVSDYVVWYAKERDAVKYRALYLQKQVGAEGASQYSWARLNDGRLINFGVPENASNLPVDARICNHDNITSQRPSQGADVREFKFTGRVFTPGKGTFKSDELGLTRLARAERLLGVGSTLRYVRFLDDFPVYPLSNLWADTVTSGFADKKVYVVQTSPTAVERCLLMTTDPGDLVLDPTCGSGTTAYVAEQWGRRWIACDTSRVALALARTRLVASRFPYFLLADSPAGVAKESELSGRTPPDYATTGDIKKGFVYKRVPHVTLKSIANNDEIDAIHTKYEPQLETLRSELNKLAGTEWEEWEVPRPGSRDEGQGARDKKVESLLEKWWELRQKRQKEIDASIARHADQELLYDQPYEDPGIVRVTGPFTVESLSPHRRITVAERLERDQRLQVREVGTESFGHVIIENLKKAGIQARDRAERLKFDTLEPFAGEWIHAVGTFTDADGKTKRVALCIGPEHGTVGPDLVKEAAKEAVKGVGFDLLYILGFAFDPHVDEERKRYGKLNVQICRMNPDLSMGTNC